MITQHASALMPVATSCAVKLNAELRVRGLSAWPISCPRGGPDENELGHVPPPPHAWVLGGLAAEEPDSLACLARMEEHWVEPTTR